MKRGFTLVELMIVIAVLVTLMAITFRIANIASSAGNRTATITRMQRLENCLSGFHAAFGCYPPVKLHGNRSFGDQEQPINWGDESKAWESVREICLTQPVACRFPLPGYMSGSIKEMSDLIAEAAGSREYEDVFNSEDMRNWASAGFRSAGDTSVRDRFEKTDANWGDLKLFQYGVLSYLLPRYIIMMGGSSGKNETFVFQDYAQWTQNNQKPCDPFTGRPMEWMEVYELVKSLRLGDKGENVVKLQMMPSQSVCARWLPNLEELCSSTANIPPIFGINVVDGSGSIFSGAMGQKINIENIVSRLRKATFSPDGYGYRDQYVLGELTVYDGWDEEFYYYSRPPYQSYTLWSSGPDKKTFPTWLAEDRLSSQELEFKIKWTKDDIIHMSN